MVPSCKVKVISLKVLRRHHDLVDRKNSVVTRDIFQKIDTEGIIKSNTQKQTNSAVAKNECNKGLQQYTQHIIKNQRLNNTNPIIKRMTSRPFLETESFIERIMYLFLYSYINRPEKSVIVVSLYWFEWGSLTVVSSKTLYS